MRYLIIILVLASCNYDSEKATSIAVDTRLDSLIEQTDSTNLKLATIDTFAAQVEYQIGKLNNEKEALQEQLDNQVKYITISKPDTSKDRLIASLRSKLSNYENEIARLKSKPAKDAQSIMIDRVPNPVKIEPEKPNETSLIIETKPYYDFDIYLVPYSKKAKKIMIYEISCDLSLIKKLGGKVSGVYKGQHFFNNVPEGKYVIKFCTYLGLFQVIERTNEKQVITLATSPPIK